MTFTVDTAFVPRLTNISALLDGLSDYDVSKKIGQIIPLRMGRSTVEVNRPKQRKIIVIHDIIIADKM
jgi:hypothetical protein